MATILIVEDETCIADTLAAILEDEGHEVAVARNGREGLEKVARLHPDLVLCDVMMPVLDGREVCRTMHESEAMREIPLIMMSAAPRSLLELDCEAAAMLPKPLDLRRLFRTIDEQLQRHAQAGHDGRQAQPLH